MTEKGTDFFNFCIKFKMAPFALVLSLNPELAGE